MWHFWLIAAGIFLIVEIITTGFLVFWLGIAALITMFVSFFTDDLIIQSAVFLISSTILIIATKPLVKKFINSKDNTVTNAYSIIGKHGIVKQEIDNSKNIGQIKVNGEVWTAINTVDEIIQKNSKVEIIKIDGVKAVVQVITSDKTN